MDNIKRISVIPVNIPSNDSVFNPAITGSVVILGRIAHLIASIQYVNGLNLHNFFFRMEKNSRKDKLLDLELPSLEE